MEDIAVTLLIIVLIATGAAVIFYDHSAWLKYLPEDLGTPAIHRGGARLTLDGEGSWPSGGVSIHDEFIVLVSPPRVVILEYQTIREIRYTNWAAEAFVTLLRDDPPKIIEFEASGAMKETLIELVPVGTVVTRC